MFKRFMRVFAADEGASSAPVSNEPLTLHSAAAALASRREAEAQPDDKNKDTPRREDGRFQQRAVADEPVKTNPGEAEAEPELEIELGDEPDDANQPAIDPPSSWTAEDKKLWEKLEPDMQQRIAQTEKRRDEGIQKSLREAAEQKKLWETEAKQTTEMRERLTQALNESQAILTANIVRDFPGVNPNDPYAMSRLAQESPEKYVALQARLQELQTTINAQRGLEAQRAEEGKKGAESFQTKRKEDLLKMDSQLSDPKYAEKFETEVVGFLQAEGYTVDEIKNLDAKALMIVRDANRYRSAVAKAKAKPQGKAAPVLRSGSPRGDEAKREKVSQSFDKLRQTGSLQDALAVYQSRKAS